MERWEKFLKNWDIALKEKKQIIVLTDDNMDFGNSVFNNKYSIGRLCELTSKFIMDNNLTIHNNQNTKWVRFRGTPCTISYFNTINVRLL